MIDLKDLGITQEELQERTIDALCERLLSRQVYDPDSGEDSWSDSPFAKKLDERIKSHIDSSVDAVAQEHVLPRVSAMLEGICLQKTNEWGEPKGDPVTFTEYLIQRAEHYLTEKVNFKGESRREDRYGSFSPTQTRVTFLVEKHLHYSIQTAMENALKDANSVIVGGIEETVKLKLKELSSQMKVKLTKER